VFWNPRGFWRPLLQLFDDFIHHNLAPPSFAACWDAVESVDQVLPALRAMAARQESADKAAPPSLTLQAQT
jgi:predicted Rossmann-fold nucleotide-binding protein